jgi:hypothetical protein
MTSYTFDNQNITWNKLGNIEHLEYSMLVGSIPLVKNGVLKPRINRRALTSRRLIRHRGDFRRKG